MKKNFVFVMICGLVFIFLTSACGSSKSDSMAARAGEWEAESEIGKITFTVNDSGTAITKAVVDFKCETGPLLWKETVNLENKKDGWIIKNNKFIIDDFKKSNLGLFIDGKFNNEGTSATGTLSVRGCSADWKTINHAPVAINTPVSVAATKSPTTIPPVEIDLESILILPGDLPLDFSEGEVSDTLPEGFADITNYEKIINQEFEKTGKGGGDVTVFLFDSTSYRDIAYQSILDRFEDNAQNPGDLIYVEQDIPDIGEKATYQTMDGLQSDLKFNIGELVFTRCNALIEIASLDTINIDAIMSYIITYAVRLDERLTPLVCP